MASREATIRAARESCAEAEASLAVIRGSARETLDRSVMHANAVLEIVRFEARLESARAAKALSRTRPRRSSAAAAAWKPSSLSSSALRRAMPRSLESESVDDLIKGLRKDPTDLAAMAELGRQYGNMERPEQAIQYLEKGLRASKRMGRRAPAKLTRHLMHLGFEMHLWSAVEQRERLVETTAHFASAARFMRLWLDTREWDEADLAEATGTLQQVTESLGPFLEAFEPFVCLHGSIGPAGDLEIEVLQALRKRGLASQARLSRLGGLLVLRKDVVGAKLVYCEVDSGLVRAYDKPGPVDVVAASKEVDHAFDVSDAIATHRERKRLGRRPKARMALCTAEVDRSRVRAAFAARRRHDDMAHNHSSSSASACEQCEGDRASTAATTAEIVERRGMLATELELKEALLATQLHAEAATHARFGPYAAHLVPPSLTIPMPKYFSP